MIPQTGDIWYYRSPRTDSGDAIVLIHEPMCETRNLSGGEILVYWGYDMLTGQYDEWLFPQANMDKYWTRLA